MIRALLDRGAALILTRVAGVPQRVAQRLIADLQQLPPEHFVQRSGHPRVQHDGCPVHRAQQVEASMDDVLMLPVNKWENEYQRVVLGGITCDSHDYYDSEEHINEVFLPKLNTGTGNEKDAAANKEPLYVGFFHTGAYQDQISGYGGIKHCMIPSPQHVIIGHDKNGKLTDWVYAKEQSAQSMLKILGYK